MKTDITKAAAEAAEGALFLGDDGSILWKPNPHAKLHFWRNGSFRRLGMSRRKRRILERQAAPDARQPGLPFARNAVRTVIMG
jgi:hypothetical protein